MKVLISVDIEGVAGVYRVEQTRPGNGDYERARLLMTEEANAAIAGAFEGGATEVLVNDSHGSFCNMPPDLLDERARAVQGKPRYLGMMGGVDQGVDAVCLIGYHARAHQPGILAHTVNSFAFASVSLNGRELGEAGLYGALAGDHGVPVVMASGDDAFIAETKDLFPAARFVETKRAGGNTSGIGLSPVRSRRAIRQGVKEALSRPFGAPFRIVPPIEGRIRAQTPALADLFCQWPDLVRLSGDEVEFTAPSVAAAVRIVNCLSAMSSFLR